DTRGPRLMIHRRSYLSVVHQDLRRPGFASEAIELTTSKLPHMIPNPEVACNAARLLSFCSFHFPASSRMACRDTEGQAARTIDRWSWQPRMSMSYRCPRWALRLLTLC